MFIGVPISIAYQRMLTNLLLLKHTSGSAFLFSLINLLVSKPVFYVVIALLGQTDFIDFSIASCQLKSVT